MANPMQAFAKENGREEFDLVMTPRVRGLKACMDALKGAKPDILDVTITYHSYTGEVPTWDMGMS